MIDAHQHFWSLATPGHEWPTSAEAGDPSRFRSRGPAWDRPLASIWRPPCWFSRSPATPIPTGCCDLAGRTPLVAAVVGWVDLAAPDAPKRIAALAPALRKCGGCARCSSRSRTPTGCCETTWRLPSLAMQQHARLRFDALIQPRHLPMLARFADRWPRLPIVIDHGAKRRIVARDELDPWQGGDRRAGGARRLVQAFRPAHRAGQQSSRSRRSAPYVEHLVETFGPRLMWGSDWPVLHLSGDSLSGLDRDRRIGSRGWTPARPGHGLFAGAAAEFYGLSQAGQSRKMGETMAMKPTCGGGGNYGWHCSRAWHSAAAPAAAQSGGDAQPRRIGWLRRSSASSAWTKSSTSSSMSPRHPAARHSRLQLVDRNRCTARSARVPTTNFPEPIGLAATFDAPLVQDVAGVISTEVRGLHTPGAADRARPDGSAPASTPGRPTSTSSAIRAGGEARRPMARIRISPRGWASPSSRGMQGRTPDLPDVIATPKHFAVHSGPESTRHGANVFVSPHDLEDTYLPAFRAAIVEGKARIGHVRL